MPPAVTYWTGTWDPGKEAISKEISALRTGSRAGAPVVAFSPGNRSRLSVRDRVLTLSPRASIALRAAAAAIERRGDVTHLFGGMYSWHLFRALGRRPIVMTAVDSRHGVDGLPNSRIARIVVESETDRIEWLKTGLPHEKIEIVYPGTDLEWYRPAPVASERLTLLFASTPADPLEIDGRGVPLLVELARARPDVDILVPWRAWGDVAGARRAIESLQPPANFLVAFEDVADMRVWYGRAHATVLCGAEGVGKSCPNFVLEGLASGRPCLITDTSAMAPLVSRSGAGVVVNRDVLSLSAAVDQLRSGWRGYAERARRLAETHFDVLRFRARYEQLYQDVAEEATAPQQSAAARRFPAV